MTIIPVEIKYNRFAYLITVPFILLLMGLFYWFVLRPESVVEDRMFYYVAIGVQVVGAFLVFQCIRQFIKSPVIFRMDQEGFEYNPAGVSSGLVRWKEIDSVRETAITTMSGNAPGKTKVLAVKMKDPKAYRSRYNAVLRGALALSEEFNDATVLIEPAALGKQYDEIKEIMIRRTSERRELEQPE